MRGRLIVAIAISGAAVAVLLAALPALSTHSAPDRGLVCTNGVLNQGPNPDERTFDLVASAGTIYMPDGNTVFMWSYHEAGHPFQVPGPVLCAKEGERVIVRLTNSLPDPPGAAGIDNVSIVFPGQAGVTATGGVAATWPLVAAEAAAGGTVTYGFVASQAGTYLYESGTNPAKQIEMGLSGGMIVRPAAGDDHAYNADSTRFNTDREHLLLLSEVDSDLHHDVERGRPFDPTARKARYYLINGRAFPDVIADNFVPWLPSQPYGGLVTVQPFDMTSLTGNQLPAMVRYVNAGLDNHPFHPHANHLRVLGRDGRMLQGPAGDETSFEDFTRTVASGQTYDLTFYWTDAEHWSPSNPIPVTLPTYRNLMFPEDVTYYGGSPYLGYRGTLPTVVTSYSVCGEYYFPWHSHDLVEIVNFDEAFGGMMTLLRVDPAGGLSFKGVPCT